jgi:flagellar export protein FliJ
MTPKFSLQPVLDYRHNRVEILEVELGRLLQAQQRGQTFLETLKESQARLFEQLSQCQQGEIDLFLLARLRSTLKVVNERIQRQQERLRQLAEQVQSKRQEVVAAHQDEEVLLTLKNHEIERYQQEQARQENRLQDDIYTARAYQRSTE